MYSWRPAVLSLAAVVFCTYPLHAESEPETLHHDLFGELAIYRPGGDPKGLVLVISGEPGWNPDMEELAKTVAGLNYLVAGVDGTRYLQQLDDSQVSCADPAADLQKLSRYLQQVYPQVDRKAPLLVGYAAGAALAYVALAQAPAGTFHAALSVDYCPQLSLQKALCQGLALESNPAVDFRSVRLSPVRRLPAPWFLFQSDPACGKDVVMPFIDQVDGAKLVFSGKGASEEKKWLPQLTALLQWLDPSIGDQVQADADVRGVPLREVPATGTADARLAVMLSGDGGWAALDRAVAAELSKRGIGTVGWDSLSYFWQAKTPEQAGRDLERVLRHYLAAWNKQRVLLIGYSFGADVLAFMANRLAPELRERVELVAFLGLDDNASFEFHLSDWIGSGPTEGTLPVRPEVAKLGWTKRLCIYGAEEADSACPSLIDAGVAVIKMPGDHHFGGDYPALVKQIVEHLSP